MATFAAITDKSTRAAELRTESAALAKELAQAKEKLESAQRAIAPLESKRDEFARDLADGKTVKLSAVAEANAAIATANLPVQVLQNRVTEKQNALEQVRANLTTLEREIAVDAAREARHRRFDTLTMRLRGVTGEVSEMLRILIELKLPELDSAVQDLTREFINVGGVLNTGITPESAAARAAIHESVMELFDGPYIRWERARLRQGWQPRDGRLAEFQLRTLFLPR